MYFITTKRMLEVCFSAHPNIQYRTLFSGSCFAHVCLRLLEWGWSMGQDYTYAQKVPLCSFGLLCVIIYLNSCL